MPSILKRALRILEKGLAHIREYSKGGDNRGIRDASTTIIMRLTTSASTEGTRFLPEFHFDRTRHSNDGRFHHHQSYADLQHPNTIQICVMIDIPRETDQRTSWNIFDFASSPTIRSFGPPVHRCMRPTGQRSELAKGIGRPENPKYAVIDIICPMRNEIENIMDIRRNESPVGAIVYNTRDITHLSESIDSNMSPTDQLQDSFAIKDVTIFTGDEFIEKGVVIVENGKIVKISALQNSEPLSENVSVISKPGHTLIPGLIDSHIHALEGNTESLEQSLRFGVTTVCDMHNDPKSIAKLQKLAIDPNTKNIYSDFKCAGAGASIEGGWPAAVIEAEYKDKPEIAKAITNSLPKLKGGSDAAEFVKTQISQNGASYIKLMHELGDTIDIKMLPRPSLEIQKSVVKTAHEHGLIAVGHAFSHAGAMDLLNSGVDGLTHAFMDKPPTDDWLHLMKHNNAHCTPTLALCASQLGHGDTLQQPFMNHPLAQRMLINKTPRQNVGLGVHNPKGSLAQAIQNVQAMHRASIPLVVGSDCAGKHLGTVYGLGVHVEMHLLAHRVGMQPEEVLKSATSVTADRFGFHDRGRIMPGKIADMVLLEGDVRKVLADPDSLCLPIKAVWRDGVLAEVYEREV